MCLTAEPLIPYRRLWRHFESVSYEDAIRKAVSIGGDSDTIACITGGIAQAYYKRIPEELYYNGLRFLDSGLIRVLREFEEIYKIER